MKEQLVTIHIPCFNEVGNVRDMANAVTSIMKKEPYKYEIVFVDNGSSDGTQKILKELAENDYHIKVALRTRNYGISPRVAQSERMFLKGDVIIDIPCDFQDPPELIPSFIRKYEEGYKIVCGQKMDSEEGKIKYSLRQLYYHIIGSLSETPQTPNISGITLYTKEILIELSKGVDQRFRFAIADMGTNIALIPYKQRARKSGKSSYNIWRYLSFSIETLISTSTAPLRIMSVFGFLSSILTFVIGIIYLLWKLINWNMYSAGTAPMLIGMFFLGSVTMFSLGVLGEYIGVILNRVTKMPDVQYAELINFDEINEE